MTSIRDRIIARADLSDARAARDITTLATGLNEQPESTVQSRFITARGIMASCADGNAILDALDAASARDSAVRRAMTFLNQEAGLDIGDPYTQSMIDQLVTAAVLTADQGAQLKALALKPVYVTQEQVADALYNADGSEKAE